MTFAGLRDCDMVGEDNDEKAKGGVTPNLGIGRDIDGPRPPLLSSLSLPWGSEAGGRRRTLKAQSTLVK